MRKTILLMLILFSTCAFSQSVKVSSAVFQYTPSAVAKKKIYYETSFIKLKPDGRPAYVYRIEISLKNNSSRPAEGLVFKYSLRMIVKKGESVYRDVVFIADDLRVSRIAPGAEKKAYIYNLDMGEQLRRLKNSGFEPYAVELETAKEPRKEDDRLELSVFSIPFSRN